MHAELERQGNIGSSVSGRPGQLPAWFYPTPMVYLNFQRFQSSGAGTMVMAIRDTLVDMSLLKDRYRKVVVGEVSCFDRVVISGTLTEICHSAGISQYLLSNDRRILDLPRVR
jgi:hypothetical protein